MTLGAFFNTFTIPETSQALRMRLWASWRALGNQLKSSPNTHKVNYPLSSYYYS